MTRRGVWYTVPMGACSKIWQLGLSPSLAAVLGVALALTGLAACSSAGSGTTVQPGQIVTSEPTGDDTNANGGNGTSDGNNAENPAGNNATSNTTKAPGYVMEGMVGQVNGQAIYADQVFEPMHEQLGALGRQLSRGEFRQRARQLILGRLNQIVADSLILGEAQRDLSDVELDTLRVITLRHREQLLRQYGQGSLALAQTNIRKDTGLSLEQNIEDFRNRRIVQRYLQKKLYPRINVAFRDIERYYREHREEFNPPAVRTIRIVRLKDKAALDTAQAILKEGGPFAELASSKLNLFNPDSGGLLEDQPGDAPLRYEQLNTAMVALSKGQTSDPIKINSEYWLLRVEKIEQPKQLSLVEAQAAIESTLRAQQFRRLSDQYRARLFREGSYNPIDQMTADLVNIALSRYAAGDATSHEQT